KLSSTRSTSGTRRGCQPTSAGRACVPWPLVTTQPRQVDAVPLAAPAADADLTDLLADAAAATPHRVQVRRIVAGRWQDVTCRELEAEVVAVARGLVAEGVAPGDRVGIWSRTRYEWTV